MYICGMIKLHWHSPFSSCRIFQRFSPTLSCPILTQDRKGPAGAQQCPPTTVTSGFQAPHQRVVQGARLLNKPWEKLGCRKSVFSIVFSTFICNGGQANHLQTWVCGMWYVMICRVPKALNPFRDFRVFRPLPVPPGTCSPANNSPVA